MADRRSINPENAYLEALSNLTSDPCIAHYSISFEFGWGEKTG